ncbi:phosphotransferase [Paenibacillus sp. yr247]|uniref:phosphotransferase n=1 Tax=Paenibacillus sp. yr247 TaxID=1761880 RepID=UPI0020C8AC7B|nr:phosphotransferase [Paenibacillus sp. yr247]
MVSEISFGCMSIRTEEKKAVSQIGAVRRASSQILFGLKNSILQAPGRSGSRIGTDSVFGIKWHERLRTDPFRSWDRRRKYPWREISFYATSFKHAPGRKIGYPESFGNSRLYEQCGRLSRRLYELAKRYKPSVRRNSWERIEYLLCARSYIPVEDESVLRALDELKERVAGMPVSPNNFGLIHGDINVGNFTVDDTGAITLFNFDECQYSWFTTKFYYKEQ